MQTAPYGFRILGSCRESRRLVDAAAAFSGYADCDEQAEIHREAYLSAFQFGDEFRARDDGWQVNVREFDGACWSPWVWWDIDREGDIGAATRDARRLAADLANRYELDGDELLIFFSGSKGFHVGLPTSLSRPEPSAVFNKIARNFAECIAEQLGIAIDSGVYDKVRAFRAPNSRHRKTGLHKRRLMYDELLCVSPVGIVERAAEPVPFESPQPPPPCDQAVADWCDAVDRVKAVAEANRNRRIGMNGSPKLNRRTMEFIRDGAQKGDRHRLLFSAAANLAEFGCPSAFGHALLSESALDSGLPPKEVYRQIECGLASVNDGRTHQDAAESLQIGESDPLDLNAEKRDTCDSRRLERQSCQQMTGATE